MPNQAAANLILAVTQAGGLAASIYNPRFWAKTDAAAIKANGSQDTLLSTFHRQRATLRLLTAIGVALFATLPALWLKYPGLAYWLASGQIVFNLCYFFAEFNPQLNEAMQLPYKSRWYVSWNPKGSRLDATLWARAWKAQGRTAPPINGPDAATQELAGDELRHLSTFAKWLGYAIYFLFAVAGYSLSYGF